MYLDLVKNLKKEQIDALEEAGVARSIVSNWKHGKRIPTRPQTLLLARVCNVNAMELEKELMLLEATPEQRAFFQKLLKIPATAVISVFLFLLLTSQSEKANADNNLAHENKPSVIYIIASVMRWLRTRLALLHRPFGSSLALSHR